MEVLMQREVAFEVYDARGHTTHVVSCPDAPTLTACGCAIKAAGDIGGAYQLYLEIQGTEPDRQIGDSEAVVFPEGRRLTFFAVPPCTGG
jgi:hypothetical protein